MLHSDILHNVGEDFFSGPFKIYCLIKQEKSTVVLKGHSTKYIVKALSDLITFYPEILRIYGNITY